MGNFKKCHNCGYQFNKRKDVNCIKCSERIKTLHLTENSKIAALKKSLADAQAEVERLRGMENDLLLMASTVDKENLRAEIVNLLKRATQERR
jgi:hypothetical protein